MILINGKRIKDASLLTESETALLRELLLSEYPKIYIPSYITTNKEKTEYKAGFLNELFLKAFPDHLKKDIIQMICERFDIFVEKRQFLNLIHEYTLKKYSVFIKN